MRKTLLTFFLFFLTFFCFATDLTGVKIYINPGHGGHDANDRSCWTINVPQTWTNPNGYWESNSNLVKGLALRDMLQEAGATVIMSRVTNNSGSRDIDYYSYAVGSPEYTAIMNGDDRSLSEIAEEANANNVDHFISIHSNALNTQTNYLLMLYHGLTGSPTVATSDQMAQMSGTEQFKNELTVWTSSRFLLYGDITFYGDDPNGPAPGLGVLRPLTVPGFLSEGSFHDYAPETHRLCNEDYCRLEALRMYQYFHKWFHRDLPQTATISGWVKSENQLVDELGHKQFYYVPNSDDQWLPLNGAMVILKDNTGAPLDTVVTDDWYNGVYAFYDLTPGTYIVQAQKAGYVAKADTVTVTAEQIAAVKFRLRYTHMDLPSFPEPEMNGAIALDHYDFEADGPVTPITTCPDRVLYREGTIYTLEDGRVVRRNMQYQAQDTLPQPADLVLSDIAFSADGYLMATRQQTGTFTVYMWENMSEPCAEFFSTAMDGACGQSLVVNGSYWKGEYFTIDGTNIKKVTYVEGIPSTTITTTVGSIKTAVTPENAWDSGILALTPSGAEEGHQVYFRYAGKVFVVQPYSQMPHCSSMGFVLRASDSTNFLSEVCLANATTAAHVFAYLDGIDIHIGVVGCGTGYQTFTSKTQPVANIYAGELNYADGTFSFRLNEDATDGTLTLEKKGQTVGTIALGAMEKGRHEVANTSDVTDFDAFSVTVSAPAIGAPAKISSDAPAFQFFAPRGVAVDKTPNSPFFGRVYVTESQGGTVSEGAPAQARTTTQGVYVLGNDFSDATNQGNTAWNGNITWGANNAGVNYQFALARPCVAPDGDVFIPSTAFASSGVYIMDAANPSADFTTVFSGKRNSSTGAIKQSGTLVTNPVMSCVVLGTGKDEVLYTMDRNNSLGTVFTNIHQYNIGESELPWNAAPSSVVFNDQNTGSHYQNGSGQLMSDGRGGWWMSQYRYNSSVAIPSLMHINAQGAIDYNCGTNIATSQQGGMGVSVDGQLIGIGREPGILAVYEAAYNAAGAPSLTEKYVINWGNDTGNTMAIDFDAAGNVYVLTNTLERLFVYALPNTSNTFTTRRTIEDDPDVAVENVGTTVATQKVIRDGQVFIIRDGVTYSILGTQVK